MMKPVTIAKILYPLLVTANKNHVKHISQLTRVASYTSLLVVDPPELKRPFIPVASQPEPSPGPGDPVNNETATNKAGLPMPIYCSGCTDDQIEKNYNISSPSFHFLIPSTYGDPCLDLFFLVVPVPDADGDTPPSHSYKYLKQLLSLAWSHNPLTTLKLICNLRDWSNDLGKSDEEAFYTAAFWLHQNHPKTLACNLASIAGSEFTESVGLLQDPVEILYRLLEGQDVRRRKQKKEQEQQKQNAGSCSISSSNRRRRREKTIAMAKKKAVEKYELDPNYRSLHDRVSDLFAEHLKSDIEKLKKKQDIHEISLATYFCPSIDSSMERATFLCESIAKKVFPRESYPEYQGVGEAYYVYKVRDRLRKEVLVPLSIALDFSQGCDHSGKPCAVKKYLEDVKARGKSKIEASALLPIEIIEHANDRDVGQVAELLWKAMVEDMIYLRNQGKGRLNNCLAVCDVSSSMAGIYMDAAVALGLLVSELSEEPHWKGKVINFSPKPELHLVQGNDLKSKCAFVRGMDCGAEIDLEKVFDLILEVAVKGNLKAGQMIKKVFVFTNTYFDSASVNSWESDHYEATKSKFKEKGYEENVVPEIVYWKMDTLVVPCRRPGVAMFGGFSKDLLKLFLDNDGVVGHHHLMEAALYPKVYQNLVVVD